MSRSLALIALLAACQPFYRDNLRAGRRAADTRAIDGQLDAAEGAAAAHDLSRAIALARAAIRTNPEYARGYAVLAVNLYHAGQWTLARTIVARADAFGSQARNALATAYANDELFADAIDQFKVNDLAGAAAQSALTGTLSELVDADAGEVDVAMGHYLRWLTAYGVPDHPLLRDARARITKRLGAAIDARTGFGIRLGAIGLRANLASTAGDLSGALTLYTLAFQVLPADKFLVYRAAMARAASKVTDPARTAPAAFGLAVDGDAALEAGKLGVAIHAYRRAVAQAPWWAAAHGNLAALLELAGRSADAKLERAWVAELAAAGRSTQQPQVAQGDLEGDGVLDANDRCPTEAEDKDGFEDADGCPDLDNDRDGIPDAKDRCRDVAEDRDGFEDADGCPDLDNDGDGIPDAVDACPLQPEIFNGTDDTDGCPDEGRVVVEPTALRLLDPIDFQGKTSKLAHTAPRILDAVVATLAGYPHLAIEIGGHGKVLGKPELDLALTRSRAEAVAAYLVAHGIAAVRLTAVGYGDTKPLAPGTDEKAAARNRRIELQIKPR